MSGSNGRRQSSKPRRTPSGPPAEFVRSFDIPSDFTAGREVQERILSDIEAHGFSEEASFAIRLALEEALINAIKHGNQLDPAKRVKVQTAIGPKRASITIEDEGPGFHRATVADPLADENLCKLHGRGILLMESYMSSVEWSDGGRRVKMVKENA